MPDDHKQEDVTLSEVWLSCPSEPAYELEEPLSNPIERRKAAELEPRSVRRLSEPRSELPEKLNELEIIPVMATDHFDLEEEFYYPKNESMRQETEYFSMSHRQSSLNQMTNYEENTPEVVSVHSSLESSDSVSSIEEDHPPEFI